MPGNSALAAEILDVSSQLREAHTARNRPLGQIEIAEASLKKLNAKKRTTKREKAEIVDLETKLGQLRAEKGQASQKVDELTARLKTLEAKDRDLTGTLQEKAKAAERQQNTDSELSELSENEDSQEEKSEEEKSDDMKVGKAHLKMSARSTQKGAKLNMGIIKSVEGLNRGTKRAALEPADMGAKKAKASRKPEGRVPVPGPATGRRSARSLGEKRKGATETPPKKRNASASGLDGDDEAPPPQSFIDLDKVPFSITQKGRVRLGLHKRVEQEGDMGMDIDSEPSLPNVVDSQIPSPLRGAMVDVAAQPSEALQKQPAPSVAVSDPKPATLHINTPLQGATVAVLTPPSGALEEQPTPSFSVSDPKPASTSHINTPSPDAMTAVPTPPSEALEKQTTPSVALSDPKPASSSNNNSPSKGTMASVSTLLSEALERQPTPTIAIPDLKQAPILNNNSPSKGTMMTVSTLSSEASGKQLVSSVDGTGPQPALTLQVNAPPEGPTTAAIPDPKQAPTLNNNSPSKGTMMTVSTLSSEASGKQLVSSVDGTGPQPALTLQVNAPPEGPTTAAPIVPLSDTEVLKPEKKLKNKKVSGPASEKRSNDGKSRARSNEKKQEVTNGSGSEDSEDDFSLLKLAERRARVPQKPLPPQPILPEPKYHWEPNLETLKVPIDKLRYTWDPKKTGESYEDYALRMNHLLEKAWRKYIINPHSPSCQIPPSLREWARGDSRILPEAGTFSENCSLHMLTSDLGWVRCPYHFYSDKGSKVRDSTAEYHTRKDKGTEYGNFGFVVTGVPGEPLDNGEDKKKKAPKAPEGYMHCGCTTKAGLAGFFLFCSGHITSELTDITEGWNDKVPTPRIRSFLIAAIEQFGSTDVLDWYSHDCVVVDGMGKVLQHTPRNRLEAVDRQIERLKEYREKIVTDLREKAEAISLAEERDILAELKAEKGKVSVSGQEEAMVVI